ncbi:MAG: hypothetical protein WDZ77_01415 [Candidatus Pacearchaeota archaeon]
MDNQNNKFYIQKNKEPCLEIFSNESSKGAGFGLKIHGARNNFASKERFELLPLIFEKLSKGKMSEEIELKEFEKNVD